MPRAVSALNRSATRVFITEDGGSPAHAPEYQGLARALAPSWSQGSLTPQRAPSDQSYGDFFTYGNIRGAPGLPTLSIEAIKTLVRSKLLRVIRKGCPIDIHIHAGTCRNPTDFDGGFDLGIILESARPTNYGAGDLGALDFGEDGSVLETVPFEGIDYYEIKQSLAPNAIITPALELVKVVICDSKTCGACGVASDGCSHLFALEISDGELTPQVHVYFSGDGGASSDSTVVTGLGADDPSGMACVGENLVIVSEAAGKLFYAAIADILAGAETWANTDEGIDSGNEPTVIFSLGQSFTWLVGLNGYVYFTSDPTAGVSIQSAGTVTTEDLLAIHGFDELNLVAVGKNNAVIATSNGGESWAAVTGPASGVQLNAVWMLSKNEWLVGANNGKLFYTIDGGASWTEKVPPGLGSGKVLDIQFATKNVGYLAHQTSGTKGRILRTVNGGYSWYVLPGSSGLAMPANDKITSLAACTADPDVVFGAGLADDATAGFAVKCA